MRSKILAIAVFCLALAASAQAQTQKIVITTPGSALHFFPAHVAAAAGLFAAEGLDVEWVDVGAGSKQVASVIGGSATMTVLGMQPAITAAEHGADLVAFAALFNKYPIQVVLHPQVMQRIGLTPGMPIDEKVKRLAGLRIGITGVTSSTDSVLRSLLLARGLDPDKELRIQPLGTPTAMLAALSKKAIDGAMLSAPQAQIAEAGGYGQTAIDPLTGEVPELNGVPYTAMITTRDVLKRQPDVIMKATKALAKAMLLEAKDPERVQQLLQSKIFPDIDAKLFASFEPNYRPAAAPTPVITPDDYARLLKWMNILDPKPITVSYEQMIDTQFAKRAAAEILGR
jgi:NitT/TauT family transport system substrate-binding protein